MTTDLFIVFQGSGKLAILFLFLTQAIAVNGFPFKIKRASKSPFEALSEKELISKLAKSRGHAEQRMFQDASAMSLSSEIIDYCVIIVYDSVVRRNTNETSLSDFYSKYIV